MSTSLDSERSASSHRTAADLIRRTGHRQTRTRVAVLALLLGEGGAVTHQELFERLGREEGVDRVTLYRVLDWLETQGLIHRMLGDDRSWRFSPVAGRARHSHAHFECRHCGKVFCLQELSAPRRLRLPAGFRSDEVDLTVKGLCPACV